MSGESISAPAHIAIPVTPIQWDICAGMFLALPVNLYETPMLPLIVRPAITPLENLTSGSPASIFGYGYCPLRLGKKGAGDANDGKLSSL